MLNFSPATWNYGAADIGGRRLIGKAMGAEDEKADRASCRPKRKGGEGEGQGWPAKCARLNWLQLTAGRREGDVQGEQK